MKGNQDWQKRLHREILEYIRDCTRDRGYPPSMKEITVHLGFASTSTTFGHLEVMQARGLISRTRGAPRTLTVTRRGHDHLKGETVSIYKSDLTLYVEAADQGAAQGVIAGAVKEEDLFLVAQGLTEELDPAAEGKIRNLKRVIDLAGEDPQAAAELAVQPPPPGDS